MKKLFVKNFTILLLLLSISFNSIAGTYTFKGSGGEIAKVEEHKLNNDPNWVWLAALVVACCIHVEVGSNGWSAGFDCKCLQLLNKDTEYLKRKGQFEPFFETTTGLSFEKVINIEYNPE